MYLHDWHNMLELFTLFVLIIDTTCQNSSHCQCLFLWSMKRIRIIHTVCFYNWHNILELCTQFVLIIDTTCSKYLQYVGWYQCEIREKIKRRENGRNVTSFRAWPLWPAKWVGYELGGSAPHQCRWARCCLGTASGRRAVVIVCGLLQDLVVFSLTSRFFVNSHLDHSRAWIPACSLTAALVHRCYSSNLSTTTQRAIVKLRGASSELCTLFIWSV